MPHAVERRSSALHLNLILGDSAAGTFNVAFGKDGLLIDRDVLSCGPTPRRDDLDVWRKLRAEFWADLVPDLFERYETSPLDVLENTSKLGEADRITLWAATGLTEQLFIASACNLIAAANVPLDRVELVQFERVPDRRSRVIGMGELNDTQMRNHPDAIRLEEGMFGNYLALWDALTSPDPRDIESFADKHPSASAWSKEAMRRMLRRFPDASSGLPHWDFRLLAHVREHGPRARRAIGYTLTENLEDADLVGDWYLFGRLLKMGAETLPKPLVKITGNVREMRSAEIELTPFGLDVLEGRASSFPANPIEEWAAGVQLSSSRGPLWFREGDRLVL